MKLIWKFKEWLIGLGIGLGVLLAAYFTGGQQQKAKQKIEKTEKALATKQKADKARELTDEERKDRGWKR